MEQNPFLCSVEYDIPDLADLPDACFETEADATPGEPGEVSVRLVEGRLTPVQPAACPLHQDMAEFGVKPVCEKPGQCCTEFVGSTDHGTVRCAALHAARKTEQPLVALIALQKREKLPPPLFH